MLKKASLNLETIGNNLRKTYKKLYSKTEGMMHFFTADVSLKRRELFVLSLVYSAISNWYYFFYAHITLSDSLQSMGLTLSLLFHLSVAFALLFGIFVVNKNTKLYPFYAWAAASLITVCLILLASNMVQVFVITLFLGITFGLGLLSCSVYFCNLTTIKERGRASGIIAFMSLLIYPILIFSANVLGVVMICVLMSLVGLTVALLNLTERTSLSNKERTIHRSFSHKAILFYLTPWLFFCLINGILSPIPTGFYHSKFSEYVFQMSILKYIAASIGALIGGLADWVGRKMVLGTGLTLYGVSTVLGGILSSISAGPTGTILFLIFTTCGLSWGIFLAVYLVVVWGDLALTRNPSYFYALGLIPFYFFIGLGDFLSPFLQVSVAQAAFISSLIIFLSHIPLVLAPELLPDYVVREREMFLYIKRVKKLIRKLKLR